MDEVINVQCGYQTLNISDVVSAVSFPRHNSPPPTCSSAHTLVLVCALLFLHFRVFPLMCIVLFDSLPWCVHSYKCVQKSVVQVWQQSQLLTIDILCVCGFPQNRYLIGIYTDGCLPAAQLFLQQYLYVIAGVGLGLLVFQLVNILLASGLAIDVRKEKKAMKIYREREKQQKELSRM